ncbi:MAG: SAM-dependent chlorinase/fluorinase [Dehalococcoidia bacterium]|nr:SAM-dependent chlorinase/fluorinase [Dehalococcoidia bacterium]
MGPPITLTTDFGYDDAYVGAMKGAILSVNPEASIIDISHSIEPQNVLQAGFILSAAYRSFPRQTIHVAVVDPGVGSERRGVILKTSNALFVAPDNGILSYIVDDLSPLEGRPRMRGAGELKEIVFKTGVEVVSITDPRFWRHPVSPTFHGRDVFGPVAAGLSLGISLYEFGEKVNSLHVLPLPKPSLDAEGVLVGQVLHIDRFGNLITNIRSCDLPGKEVVIEIAGYCIQGISTYYAQKEGTMAIVGSSGYIEVSLRGGSACDFLGAIAGDEVKVTSAA